MCSCSSCHEHTTDICFYVPFCVVFVVLGIIQIISGIFYFITTPVIKLILNVAIGCWAILTGIGGGTVACVCPSTPKKHEFLLYCSLTVLILNLINLIIVEFSVVTDVFTGELKQYELLDSQNGRFITTLTAFVSVMVAFIESQITFCFLNRSQIIRKKEKCENRKNRRGQYIDNDQTADLEYVIPKKNELQNRKTSLDATVQVYAKSWVFEGTNEEDLRHPDDLSSLSISSASPTQSNAPNSNQKHNQTRRLSKLSDATSERFNPVMSSFSRCATPSPIPRSGQITPNHVPYTEYLDPAHAIVSHRQNHLQKLNRLTVDYVPTTAVLIQDGTATVTLKQVSKTHIQNNGPSSISSQQDDSQYASLLAELEQSLMDKKIQATNHSPDDTSLTTSTDKYCSSKSSSKDLEFSKELEAALQLIQELETPSEGPVDAAAVAAATAAQAAKFARSESAKTLSAAISLPSPEAAPFTAKSPDAQTPQNGKQIQRNIIRIEPCSQSTSGYSSPNSFSSNAQSSNNGDSSSNSSGSSTSSGVGGREQIFTGDKSNVVRIYIEPNGHCTSSNNLLTKGHILNASNLIETVDPTQTQASESLNKSFLLFKKRSKLMPHSDFQNRIFKSECLAYLTDEELVARHRCNRDVIRKIEQSVAQKIRGSPRYDEARL